MQDRKLPGLERAVHNDEMLEVFFQRLGPEFRKVNRARVKLRHRILKYNPGKRCVIEYQFHDGNGPVLAVIGKLYRKNRGEQIYRNMSVLWQAAQYNRGTARAFHMPEPLAYLPEIGMVVQTKIVGRLIIEAVAHGDISTALVAVATNLANLHRLDACLEVSRDMAQHIEKYCHPGPEVLKATLPEMASLVDEVLDGLIHDLPPEACEQVAVHGDLNFSQIFIENESASFIDFDGSCLSHAALDIANFLVALKTYFAEDYAKLEEIFLDAYCQSKPLQSLSCLNTYKALAFLRRAMISFRHQNERDWRQRVKMHLNSACASLLSESIH